MKLAHSSLAAWNLFALVLISGPLAAQPAPKSRQVTVQSEVESTSPLSSSVQEFLKFSTKLESEIAILDVSDQIGGAQLPIQLNFMVGDVTVSRVGGASHFDSAYPYQLSAFSDAFRLWVAIPPQDLNMDYLRGSLAYGLGQIVFEDAVVRRDPNLNSRLARFHIDVDLVDMRDRDPLEKAMHDYLNLVESRNEEALAHTVKSASQLFAGIVAPQFLGVEQQIEIENTTLKRFAGSSTGMAQLKKKQDAGYFQSVFEIVDEAMTQVLAKIDYSQFNLSNREQASILKVAKDGTPEQRATEMKRLELKTEDVKASLTVPMLEAQLDERVSLILESQYKIKRDPKLKRAAPEQKVAAVVVEAQENLRRLESSVNAMNPDQLQQFRSNSTMRALCQRLLE